MSEAARTVLIAFAALAAGFTWLSVRTTLTPVSSPDRLVSELRLAQIAALLLCMTAGAYIGFAVTHETYRGVGLDVAIAAAFLMLAASTLVRDPRHALPIVALGFAAHAMVDVGHRPGSLLPDGITPRWYALGCAVYDVYIGALCYLPVLRR